MKHFVFYASLLLLSLMAILTGCRTTSDDPAPQPPAAPTITAIDPATAPVGSTISVSGTNFSTDPASTTVTIGGVVATVVSATDTRLVVTVPEGVGNGPVTVTTGGQTVQSQTNFTVYVAPPKTLVDVQGTRFANQTWTRDKIYVLRGLVYIPADYTLTIEPGTVVVGAAPDRDPFGLNNAGTLIIERRAKLIAAGTAGQPIVFTSAKPAGQRSAGDWGGLVLVGKGPINLTGTAPLPGGIRGTVEFYGEPQDNSGTLRYVRIEYAGATLAGAGRPLAGLSLYGVGSGTTIDHVQVSYPAGDAFAWVGGTANAKQLLAYETAANDWSAQGGYVGNVQFAAALRSAERLRPDANGLALENTPPDATTDVAPVPQANGLRQSAALFANLSSYVLGNVAPDASATLPTALLLRRNAAVGVYNSVFYGYPEGLQIEAATAPTGLTTGAVDVRGVVLAGVQRPVTAGGSISADQATQFFGASERGNQVVPSTDVAALLGNVANRRFALPTGSPLLAGAATTPRLSSSFFTAVAYRGAFGPDDWTTGWTNFQPQTTAYDR